MGDAVGLAPVAIPGLSEIRSGLVSIAIDGFDRTIVPPLAIEVVIAGALLAAHYVLN